MRFLGFDVIYEARDKFRSLQIRKSLTLGTDDWKELVHESNIEIIEGVGLRESARPLRGRLLNSLYKHGVI